MCRTYYIIGVIIFIVLIILFLNNSEHFRRNIRRNHHSRYRSYHTDLSGLSGRNIWFNWNGRRRPYYYYPELYYNYFPFPYSYYNPCVETVDGEIMCYY